MATQAQIEANRRNALHSTGPKTAAGKRASSQNAARSTKRYDPDYARVLEIYRDILEDAALDVPEHGAPEYQRLGFQLAVAEARLETVRLREVEHLVSQNTFKEMSAEKAEFQKALLDGLFSREDEKEGLKLVKAVERLLGQAERTRTLEIIRVRKAAEKVRIYALKNFRLALNQGSKH